MEKESKSPFIEPTDPETNLEEGAEVPVDATLNFRLEVPSKVD